MISERKLTVVLIICIGILICLRIYPALTLPLHGDEGSDLYIVSRDAVSFSRFFSDEISFAFDQSRFSHLIGAIIMGITGVNSANLLEKLGTIRLVFLLFHIGYLIVSYRLIMGVSGDRRAAWIYTFLLSVSCYLSSFSISMMTTGEGVFMLFHLLSIKIFYENFQKAAEGDGIFKQFLLLSLVLALCIAGKLFGVLLLISFFVFALCNSKTVRQFSITTAHPGMILGASLSFFITIVLINVFSIPLMTKSIAALASGLLYVCCMLVLAAKEHRGRYLPRKIHFVAFWALLAFVTFTLVLVFSPIYLNLKNIINVFSWYGTWNAGAVAPDSKYYDALIILVMKYGIASTVVLVAAAGTGLFFMITSPSSDNRSPAGSFHFLIMIVITLHVVLISTAQFKLVWHPLAVFPFLYLPFAGLWVMVSNGKPVVLKYILIVAVLFVAGDNLYRYGSWYPHGHLDGGQYGSRFVGVNKPCFVTFEGIPVFFEYITGEMENDSVKIRQINVKGSNSPILNSYLQRMLALYFKTKGLGGIRFVRRSLQADRSDVIVSSPIYNPECEQELSGGDYTRIKTLSISKVIIATVWKRNN